MVARFDLYGALWLFCTEYHGGQRSRGQRILGRLTKAGYKPGLSLQKGEFESPEQEEIFYHLVDNYAQRI